MASGGQVPHFAVRFRWHALGFVNKSQGAVIPTRTPFAWPASNYSRTSSARPWIDLTTTERLNLPSSVSRCREKRLGPISRHSSADRSAGLSGCRTSRTSIPTPRWYAQSHGTLRSCPVQYCRPRTALVRAANRLLKILAGGGGRGKAYPASPAPMAGDGIFPVDVDPAVPRGPGRRAIRMAPVSWHASGHPAGLVRGPRTPRSGRRSLYSAVPRGIQVFGYIPPHLRRSTGVLVLFTLQSLFGLRAKPESRKRRGTIGRVPLEARYRPGSLPGVWKWS